MEGSLEVSVGGLSRGELNAEFRSRGIQLNAHALVLLADAVFDDPGMPQPITVVGRRVGDLGLPVGGSLSHVLSAARECGMELCPPTAGPYLRLAMTGQVSSCDPVMSRGHAPDGSFTVAAPRLRDDDEFPKGFYLRVVEGTQWLRGYRCDDTHFWSPDDRFIFQLLH
ncbi:hypothetical protein ACSYDW_00820 [Paeniglutamicibacter sp. R2-26]|uniref:hypothetical protein n=1 Tax=Paeniglutamicibacter sp. R2-26 TaxID=3144417 RepID=UPI003EE72322